MTLFSQNLGLWHHVTMVMCLFIIQEKQKQKQNKRNIKSRKINKKERKMFKSRCTITIFSIWFLDLFSKWERYKEWIRRKREQTLDLHLHLPWKKEKWNCSTYTVFSYLLKRKLKFPELVLAYKPRKGVTREASREVWQFVIGTDAWAKWWILLGLFELDETWRRRTNFLFLFLIYFCFYYLRFQQSNSPRSHRLTVWWTAGQHLDHNYTVIV